MLKSTLFASVGLLLSASTVFFSLYGCSVFNKQRCIQQKMNGHTFKYFAQDQPRGYFIIRDSVYSEFVDGKLYATSRLVWRSCEDYLIIPQQINYDNGVRVGDTLQVSVLSLQDDTLTCRASAYGQSYQFKVLRTK